MKSIFYLGLLGIVSCKASTQQQLLKIDVSRYDRKTSYYFDNSNQLISSVNNTNEGIDSTFIAYNNKGVTSKILNFHVKNNKAELYKSCDSLKNDESEDIKSPKCNSILQVKNTFGFLDDDLCYLTVLLPDSIAEGYTKNNTDTLYFKSGIGLGQLQGMSISPFIEGTQLKEITVIKNKSYLSSIQAVFLNEPTSQIISYSKIYRYDKDGRLISSITKNQTTNKIEDQVDYKYTLIK